MTVSPLTVQHAEVHTATVSIRTLTIDRKQVTLATFRQLIEEPVVTWEGEFAGVPWGAVNYCPDKKACQGRGGEHLHVVWQKDGELRRATQRPPEREFEPSPNGVDAWLAVAVMEGWRPQEWLWGREYLGCSVTFVDGLPPVYCAWPRSTGLYVAPADDSLTNYERDALTKAAEAAGDFWTEGKSADALAKEIADEMLEDQRRWTERHKRWRELEALPQLFIAT